MSSPDKSYWYSETKKLCFDEKLKIPDAAFLFLFAPHCIAANANYGKDDSERTGGVVASGRKLSKEEIQKRQSELLTSVKNTVTKCVPDEETIKSKCLKLLDETFKENLKIEADQTFAKKNMSYKKTAYLNLYLGATDCSPEEIFNDIANLYKEVFDKIYSGYEDEATLRLKALKSQCERMVPEFEINDAFSTSKQMAQCTAALLFLDADPEKYSAEYCNIRNTLFGIPEPDSASTISLPTIEAMQIKTEHYIRMCMSLLVNNPSLEDLEMVYSHLDYVKRRLGGYLDGDFITLVVQLKDVGSWLGKETFKKMQEAGYPPPEKLYVREQKIRDLLKKCEILLSVN